MFAKEYALPRVGERRASFSFSKLRRKSDLLVCRPLAHGFVSPLFESLQNGGFFCCFNALTSSSCSKVGAAIAPAESREQAATMR